MTGPLKEKSLRRGHQLVATATAAFALALGWAALILATRHAHTQASSTPPRFAGPAFPAGLRAATFTLTDQNGKPATLSQYQGRVVILSFMYSHCRDACPLMATEIRGALSELPRAGRGVPVLAISVDPAHDTPASARAFLAREEMTGRMRFLLGPYPRLRAIWKRYAIRPEFDQAERRYKYGHSAYVMLIDRKGFLRVGFPAGALVPEDLAHDLRILLRRTG